MDQSITIRIADKTFSLTAKTPESEEIIRIAADSVNKKVDAYTQKFPTKGLTDILSFVALNGAIQEVTLQRKVKGMNADIESLQSDIEAYLKNEDK